MPTTYLGRDNDNKPCYHVRKTNGLTKAAMTAGIEDDTLFHSSLPYLQVLATVDVSLSGTYTLNSDTFKVFNFPSTLNTYLNEGYLCLVSALLTDGSRVTIDNIPSMTTVISEGLYDFGSSFINPRHTSTISMGAINGFYFLNSTISSGAALGDIASDTLFTTGLQPDSVTLNASAGSGSILQKLSRCCVYRDKRVGSYATLEPSSLRFVILNIKSVSGVLSYSTLNYSGDIKISKDGLFIGGSNILSGKGFLSVGSKSKTSGTTALANDYVGSNKISLTNLNTLTVPMGTSLLRFSNPGVSKLNGFLSSNGMVLSVPSAGGTVAQKEQWCSESRTSSRVDTYNGKLKIDTFKISNIPSSTPGCTFTKDNLTVNGVQLYSPNNSNLINLNSSPARVYIGAVSSIAVSSYADGATEVMSSFTVQKPNSTLGILYNITHYSHSTDVVNTLGGIGNTNTVIMNMGNQSTSEFLGANLAILDVGDCIPIANINVSMNVEISLATASRQYDYWGIGGGVSYFFYRLNTSTVQILRRFSKYTFGKSTTALTTGLPGFHVNYLQMTTTSIG